MSPSAREATTTSVSSGGSTKSLHRLHARDAVSRSGMCEESVPGDMVLRLAAPGAMMTAVTGAWRRWW